MYLNDTSNELINYDSIYNIVSYLDSKSLRELLQSYKDIRNIKDCIISAWLKTAYSKILSNNIPLMHQLLIESSLVGVDLNEFGPQILVSDLSTKEQPLLRWSFVIHGNVSIEFGVIPDEPSLFKKKNVLHKCIIDDNGKLPVGFCSNITVGSDTQLKTPIMKGSSVELIAMKGKLLAKIQHPEICYELYRLRQETLFRKYNGPKNITIQIEFDNTYDVRLVTTNWIKASLDIVGAVYDKSVFRRLTAKEIQKHNIA